MTNYAKEPRLQWTRPHLTDTLIGPVIGSIKPRFQCHSPIQTSARQLTLATTATSHSFQGSTVDKKSNHIRNRQSHTEAEVRRLEYRVNQRRSMARYRAIEQSINELTDEIRGLELKRRDLSFQDKEHRSPCRVVADIFALLKSYFRSSGFHSKSKAEADHPATRVILNALRDLFVSDVESGNICGVDAFLGQVKTYAQLFDVPSLCLEKIVEDTPGVVAATAILQATVTISTLCFIFPHSLQVPRAGNDTQPLLGRRWLAKPLTCNCSVHFLFDAGSGRVARVEISIDWVSALLDVLGNLDDVVRALNSGFANS